MVSVMQIHGDALGLGTPHDGQYVQTMDFEAHDGRGELTTTPDIQQAMKFATGSEAMEFWRRSPECHPIRETDGRPNRPLTAYTVEIASLPA